MEAIYTSETSVDFEQTARRYVIEDSTLHNHGFENLRYLSGLNFFTGFPSLRKLNEFNTVI
jgi:hypothetical protein